VVYASGKTLRVPLRSLALSLLPRCFFAFETVPCALNSARTVPLTVCMRVSGCSDFMRGHVPRSAACLFECTCPSLTCVCVFGNKPR